MISFCPNSGDHPRPKIRPAVSAVFHEYLATPLSAIALPWSSTSRASKQRLLRSFRTACGLPALIAATALTGCGGGSSAQAPPSSGPTAAQMPQATGSSSGQPPVASPSRAVDGWYVGTARIGSTDYYGEALVTVDGLIRLYVGGPYASDGTLQDSKPATSELFAGTLDMHGAQASGSGVIIGLGCGGAAQTSPLCAAGATGAIHVVVSAGKMQGEVQVDGGDAAATWTLDLGWWPYYYTLPGAPQSVAGQYHEKVAEFANEDTVINVDSNGKLFFQSPHSGCVGNGTLTPHLDGRFGVYDVSLIIGNCAAPYSYLNGPLDGLATTSPSNYWDYDSDLLMWVSSPSGAARPVGLRFLAE